MNSLTKKSVQLCFETMWIAIHIRCGNLEIVVFLAGNAVLFPGESVQDAELFPDSVEFLLCTVNCVPLNAEVPHQFFNLESKAVTVPVMGIGKRDEGNAMQGEHFHQSSGIA